MKSYSKGAKRRNKAKLPELAKAPRPKKRGRARMAEIADDNTRANLEKRAMLMGENAGNQDVIARMKAQALSEAAGRVLTISEGDSAAKPLIEAYGALTAAYERYAARELGLNPHAKSQRIEMMPDKMPDAMEYTPDIRSAEEKDIAAKRAWAIWSGRMEAIGMGHSSAIWSAYYGYSLLHVGRQVTSAGLRFVAAMKALNRMC